MDNLNPTPAQELILCDQEHPELLFLGGVQSGKTELGAHWMMEKIMQWASVPRPELGIFGIGIPTLIQGRQSTGAPIVLADHLANRLGTSRQQILHAQDLQIDLRSVGIPAIVFTVSAQQRNVKRWGATKPPRPQYAGVAQSIWLDEIGQCPENRIHGYARAWGAQGGGQLLITTTMYLTGTWLKQILSPSDRQLVVTSSTYDNPTAQPQLDRLKKELPDWYFQLMFENQWPKEPVSNEY